MFEDSKRREMFGRIPENHPSGVMRLPPRLARLVPESGKATRPMLARPPKTSCTGSPRKWGLRTVRITGPETASASRKGEE